MYREETLAHPFFSCDVTPRRLRDPAGTSSTTTNRSCSSKSRDGGESSRRIFSLFASVFVARRNELIYILATPLLGLYCGGDDTSVTTRACVCACTRTRVWVCTRVRDLLAVPGRRGPRGSRTPRQVPLKGT